MSVAKKIEVVAVICLLSLSLFVMLQGIGNSLWQDESYTVKMYIEQGPVEIISGDSYKPNNHILYSLVGWVLVSIFGFSEFILRFPSVITTIAAFFVIFLVARKHYGKSTAITLLTLLTFGSFHIATTSSARGYGFMLLFSSLFLYFILNYVSSGKMHNVSTKDLRSKLLLASIFGFLASYTFPSFIVFAACVFAVLLFIVQKKKDVVIAMLSGAAITILAFSPLLESMIKYYINFGGGFKKHQPVNWEVIYTFPVQKIGETLARFIQIIDSKLGNVVHRLDIEQLAMILISIVFLFGIYYGMKNKKTLSLLALPPALFLGLAALFSVPLANRTDYTLFLEFNYLIIFSIGIISLIHILWRYLRKTISPRLYPLVLVGCLVLGLVLTGLVAKAKDISDQLVPRENHKAAAETVRDHFSSDEYKVVYYGEVSKTSMQLYADKVLHRDDVIIVDTPDDLISTLHKNKGAKIALITQLAGEDKIIDDLTRSSKKISIPQKTRGLMAVYFLDFATK